LQVALVAPKYVWAAEDLSLEISRTTERSPSKEEIKETGSREINPVEGEGEEEEDEGDEEEVPPTSLDELELELEQVSIIFFVFKT
jgi:hypothetical protein